MRAAYLIALAILAAPIQALAGPTARFDFVEYRAAANDSAAPEGFYRNPVLPGFHPDPSLTRVGDDFYLVTSTFAWFPGLPIFHSRDLVNWNLIGHAIDRPGMVDLAGLRTHRALFAPAITHHEDTFWILNTCVDCSGNFVITAADPAGPWSDPVWLPFDGIDPSLFFDEDGSAWIVYNDAPPGEPLYQGHRALWLQRFDPDAKELVGERTLLVNGGVDIAQQPVWAEGPHIYKVGDWYYLMTAEGGTADQHSQTIYRSASVTGPYEPGPVNPILTQRNMDPDRSDRVEATGHADMVQLDDGSWWATFLATRPFAGQSTLLGRETYLLPVRWVEGWPIFLEPGEVMPPLVERPKLPEFAGTDWSQWRDDFDADRLSLEWIRLRNPEHIQLLGLDRQAGAMWMAAGNEPAGSLGSIAFTGRRLRHHDARVETHVDFSPEAQGDFAGLLAFMNQDHFIALGIEGDGEGRMLVVRLRTDAAQDERGEVIARAPVSQTGSVDLAIELRGGSVALSARAAGESEWRMVAQDVDVEPLASIHAELFTGLVVGPYAVSGE
jgi:alpha-N-arabinofuranosidase